MNDGPYSIGSAHFPGLSKVIEECGELLQVAGKIMGANGTQHWQGDLRAALTDELSDVMAACVFFAEVNGLSEDAIEARITLKTDQFHAWHEAGDPTPPGPAEPNTGRPIQEWSDAPEATQ